MENMTKEEIEFLLESNKIEGETSIIALQDAKHAWNFAKRHKHNKMDINFIKIIHSELMRRLNPKIMGEIRDCPVMIGGKTKWNNQEEIKEELISLCKWEVKNWGNIKKWHIRFEGIHPFEDGNGRVGRILMNIQRLNAGFPILIIHEGKEQMKYYKWFKEDNK